jgi:hypothetical protein
MLFAYVEPLLLLGNLPKIHLPFSFLPLPLFLNFQEEEMSAPRDKQTAINESLSNISNINDVTVVSLSLFSLCFDSIVQLSLFGFARFLCRSKKRWLD